MDNIKFYNALIIKNIRDLYTTTIEFRMIDENEKICWKR